MIEKNGELWDIKDLKNKKEYDETLALFKDEVKIGNGKSLKKLTIAIAPFRIVPDDTTNPHGARSHMGAQKPASDTFPFSGVGNDGAVWAYADRKIPAPTGDKGNDGKGWNYIIDGVPGGYITMKGISNDFTELNIEKVFVLVKLGKVAMSAEECVQGTHNYYIKNDSTIKTMTLDKETANAEMTIAVNKMDALKLRSVAQAMLMPYVANYDNEADLRISVKGWLLQTDKRDSFGKQLTSAMKIKDFMARAAEKNADVNPNRKTEDDLNTAVSILMGKDVKLLTHYPKERKWLFKTTPDVRGEIIMSYTEGQNALEALIAFLNITPEWAERLIDFQSKLDKAA